MNNNLFRKEMLVNFALLYSFIIGTIFISYSIYRGLVNPFLYLFPLILFIVYLTFWVKDKKRLLYENRKQNTF